MFYNAYATSIITYGSVIYGAAAKPNPSKIESVEKRILRAIVFRKRPKFIAKRGTEQTERENRERSSLRTRIDCENL